MIFDTHLDLAMNALEWNRDFTRPIEEIRERERGKTDRPDRGQGTVSFDEMRRGGIGLCVATQIARYVKPSNTIPGWHSPEQAWAMTQAQLAWYSEMERRGELVQIRDCAGLDAQLQRWTADEGAGPIGYVLSLEGADSIVTMGHLEQAVASGLRAVGPAHYGPGTYAYGTDSDGSLGVRGRELLRQMDRHGLILDATHLSDTSFWEALDLFKGPVWASHNNCRALVPHQRQFSDEQLQALIARGAIVGAALDAWMLVPGWQRGVTTPAGAGLTLEHVIDHIDHVCQLAGNARHAAIGSDLDGGFGREQTCTDVETIADLARIPDLLAARGYSGDDVAAIAHGNTIEFLRRAWR
jgi:membrane dipeptidase